MSKTVCGICGALYVPHEDNDGSYRRVEQHYAMCAAGRGMAAQMGIFHSVKVADDWQRPAEEEFEREFESS